MVQARRYVEAPAGQPVPFGLLSVAIDVTDNDPHTALGVEYESLACAEAFLTAGECFDNPSDPDPDPLSDHTSDGRSLIGADAFQVFSLHTCRLVGSGGADQARADAGTKLANGEGRAIESQLALRVASADDLTPAVGTAVTPLAGLAILEDFARSTYSSVPVFHMSPGEATILAAAGAVDRYSGRLETKIGSRVAAGGGYDVAFAAAEVGGGDTQAAAGERWLWVTGTVVVRRGEVNTTDMTIDAHAPKNEFMTLAQRSVVVTTECVSAAVLVQSPAATAGVDGGGA